MEKIWKHFLSMATQPCGEIRKTVAEKKHVEAGTFQESGFKLTPEHHLITDYSSFCWSISRGRTPRDTGFATIFPKCKTARKPKPEDVLHATDFHTWEYHPGNTIPIFLGDYSPVHQHQIQRSLEEVDAVDTSPIAKIADLRWTSLNYKFQLKCQHKSKHVRKFMREIYSIWLVSNKNSHKPHQSHGLAMDKQSEQGSEPEKKESNGQTPQTQQTEERAQHGSWQTKK